MSLPTVLSKNIESFALDFVRLIRGVRVYPSKHPALIGVAQRVMASVPFDSTGLFTIGVTPTELIVSGEFVAGKATRLASILHARKVLQIHWTKEARVEDVWTLCRLLSTPKLEGAELRQRLHTEGVYAIDLEPLDLERIHRGISDEGIDPKHSSEERRRNAWFLLVSHEARPEQIARAFSSEAFWLDAKAHWAEAGYGDSEGFTELMLKLEERFEAALSLLPDSRRKEVFDYLAEMGKTLSIPDLVRILAQEGKDHVTIGHGVASLFREMDGERLVDLLASLAAGGDKGKRRFIEVYRHFNPARTESLLPLVQSRISLKEGNGFAVDIWKTVEKLIVEFNENPFMDSEYSESLERLVDLPVSETTVKQEPELLQDPDHYLDKVLLGLAAKGDERWQRKLLERIEAHVEQSGVFEVFGLIRLVDEVRLELLDSVPAFIKKLFRRSLSDLCKASPIERQAFVQFVLRHEGVLVDVALKALAEEERISVRYFLVTVLSSFSSASTPAFVAKARNGPWYVTRNLAIVLGQQRVPYSVPTLRALSNHSHPKVRKEALRALRNLDNLDQGSELDTLQTEEGWREQKQFLTQRLRTEPAETFV